MWCAGTTECSLNIVVFFRIFKNIPNSICPRCQCVYTHQAGRKPALQKNWQSSEKSQHLKEKTQYLMNTLYVSHSLRPACVSIFTNWIGAAAQELLTRMKMKTTTDCWIACVLKRVEMRQRYVGCDWIPIIVLYYLTNWFNLI